MSFPPAQNPPPYEPPAYPGSNDLGQPSDSTAQASPYWAIDQPPAATGPSHSASGGYPTPAPNPSYGVTATPYEMPPRKPLTPAGIALIVAYVIGFIVVGLSLVVFGGLFLIGFALSPLMLFSVDAWLVIGLGLGMPVLSIVLWVLGLRRGRNSSRARLVYFLAGLAAYGVAIAYLASLILPVLIPPQ